MNVIPLPPGGGATGLALLPPKVRFVGPAPGRREDASWRDDGNGTWRFDDGTIRLDVRVREAASRDNRSSLELHVAATALSDARIGTCTFRMGVLAPRAPRFLDSRFRWRTLDRKAVLNDFGHSVARWESPDGGQTELRASRGSVPGEISWTSGTTIVEITLDAAALHPRWQFTEAGRQSTAGVSWTGAQIVDMLVAVVPGGSVAHRTPAVVSRYPHGAEAGFALTDHCDFDDEGLLHLFLRGDARGAGWLATGLRLTKGVFLLPSSPAIPDPVPTLGNERYRALVEELHAGGSEIAPHALSERGTVPPSEFRAAVKRFAHAWRPGTWIDHGKTIPYCYTMGGAAGYGLLDVLRENGFCALWSYHDSPVHGSAGLNLLVPPRRQRLPIMARLSGHVMKGEITTALHYGRSLLTSSVGGRWGEVSAQAMSAARGFVGGVSGGGRPGEEFTRAWRRVRGSLREATGPAAEMLEEPYTRRELLAMGSVVYPERAVPLHQAGESDLLLFTTMEAVHTQDMYTPGAIERLIQERGLHVGHTYLLNRLPYIAGIFERSAARLTDSWRDFVTYLADAARSGRVWNPTAGELACWTRDRECVSLTPLGPAELRLENPLSRLVRGFTILLPRDTAPSGIRWNGNAPAGWRQWDDWLAVWGDLPPRSAIAVCWGAGE